MDTLINRKDGTMGYTTYYLKAPDKDTAIQAAKNADIGLIIQDKNGNDIWSSYSSSLNTFIDPEIEVWEIFPEYDSEGDLINEGKLEDGYFANLNVRDSAQQEFNDLITESENLGVVVRSPTTPQRKFL